MPVMVAVMEIPGCLLSLVLVANLLGTEPVAQARHERVQEAGLGPDELASFFASALVAPVLTAHPTEVRRTSIIDRESAIADLLPAYDYYAANKAKRLDIEVQLKRDLTYSDSDVLGKEQEESLLFRDMQSDAVSQLLRQLQAPPQTAAAR